MYTKEDFTTDVERNFQFLESEYGMRREPVQVGGVGFWMAYGNPTVRVIVERDVGGYCTVSVQNLRHIKRDPLERSEFDLEEIVAISPRQPRRPDPRSMSEVVARAAETLRSVGVAALKGDFEALHARQRKMVEAVRRTNPLTSA